MEITDNEVRIVMQKMHDDMFSIFKETDVKYRAEATLHDRVYAWCQMLRKMVLRAVKSDTDPGDVLPFIALFKYFDDTYNFIKQAEDCTKEDKSND